MKKLQVWIPLLFSIVMIFGMVIGYRLQGNISPKGFFSTHKQTPVQEVLDLVKQRYVDSVHTDSLGTDAIQGMLAHLDPHSIYIPAMELGEVNEDLQGNFEGIGVEFQIFDDTVNVVSVLAGGPSEKAGLKVGDKFLKVNDSVVAGNGISGDKIKKFLRGPGASLVNVTVLRGNESKQFSITRGTIPSPSLDVSYMIEKGVGFIRLNRFSETTHAEFAQAVMKLQQQGLEKLILDLRGNGGGVLQEAVAIADDFLDQDKLIVYTQGVNSPKVEYRCRMEGLFEKGKLVLLVDEGTASASEILTGALQDWDRATIIGRRTFGKGLVQEQYQLSDGSALRLTVARYYTPLGRSIQKPYNKDDHESYNEEVMKRFHDGEVFHGDTATNHNGKAYTTKNGHVVYGGGGITPDIFIAFDTSTFDRNISALYGKNTLSRFLYTYYIQNNSAFNNYKTPDDFNAQFHDEEKVWNNLVNYAAKDSINLKLVPGKDKEMFQKRLKALLARQIWRLEGYFEVANTNDEAVKKALEVIKN
ncbi:MAG: S41 family peptidase [Bacteroidetes bacterium]|nr:S41 family peptidase [Bacteroidota bacterium]